MKNLKLLLFFALLTSNVLLGTCDAQSTDATAEITTLTPADNATFVSGENIPLVCEATATSTSLHWVEVALTWKLQKLDITQNPPKFEDIGIGK